MIILNSEMNNFFLSRSETKVPSNLEIQVLEGFYEDFGVIVFSFYKNRLENGNYETIISRYKDLTGFESSMNRIHIDDYIDNEKYKISEVIDIGFALVELVQSLWNKLRTDECTIILSTDLESEFGSNASVTFHKKRIDEVLIDNLDSCIQPVFICDNNDSIVR